jgi:hypothetical protein
MDVDLRFLDSVADMLSRCVGSDEYFQSIGCCVQPEHRRRSCEGGSGSNSPQLIGLVGRVVRLLPLPTQLLGLVDRVARLPEHVQHGLVGQELLYDKNYPFRSAPHDNLAHHVGWQCAMRQRDEATASFAGNAPAHGVFEGAEATQPRHEQQACYGARPGTWGRHRVRLGYPCSPFAPGAKLPLVPFRAGCCRCRCRCRRAQNESHLLPPRLRRPRSCRWLHLTRCAGPHRTSSSRPSACAHAPCGCAPTPASGGVQKVGARTRRVGTRVDTLALTF